MNILVTNDDGINAEGIKNLVSALSEVANIYVSAPNEQKSACGHGITLGKAITVEDVTFENAEKAFCVAGTPVDCVKIGLDILKEEGIKIDKVFSGINHGSNLGTDTLYSGTVAGALEGLLCGIPSVAVSINSLSPIYYEVARELAVRAAKLDFSKISNEMVININVPHLPKEEIKGVKITGLGFREYDSWCKAVPLDSGLRGFKYGGRPVKYDVNAVEENDVGADQLGYATITPLQYDLTNYKLIEELKTSTLAEMI